MNSDIPSETRKCPDCGGKLERIRILDATYPAGMGREPSSHYDLTYAEEFARASWFRRRVEIAGRIHGYICGGCSRIFMYGDPLKWDPLPGAKSRNSEEDY